MATIQKLLSNIFFFEGSLYKNLQIKVSFNLRVYSYFSNICQVRNIMCLYIILNDGDIHEEHFSYFPFQKNQAAQNRAKLMNNFDALSLRKCSSPNVTFDSSLYMCYM